MLDVQHQLRMSLFTSVRTDLVDALTLCSETFSDRQKIKVTLQKQPKSAQASSLEVPSFWLTPKGLHLFFVSNVVTAAEIAYFGGAALE